MRNPYIVDYQKDSLYSRWGYLKGFWVCLLKYKKMGLAKSFIREGSIEPRLYQETILETAVNKNTLVVLPTGLGKTYIAALVAAKRLELNMVGGKILFLAPTKPLVEQHATTWKDIFSFPKGEFKAFPGLLNPH